MEVILAMNYHSGDEHAEDCDVCSILKTVAEIVRDKDDL